MRALQNGGALCDLKTEFKFKKNIQKAEKEYFVSPKSDLLF